MAGWRRSLTVIVSGGQQTRRSAKVGVTAGARAINVIYSRASERVSCIGASANSSVLANCVKFAVNVRQRRRQRSTGTLTANCLPTTSSWNLADSTRPFPRSTSECTRQNVVLRWVDWRAVFKTGPDANLPDSAGNFATVSTCVRPAHKI